MTFPSSPFPRTEFDGTPCSGYRRDKFYKSIGLPRCERCDSDYCTQPYYRWEQERNFETSQHRDCFVHVPPRDFPILRSSPLWQQTWVQHGQSFNSSSSGYGKWFPPLACGPSDKGGRRKFVGFTTSNYRRVPAQLFRLYSTDNCSDCTAALQAVELMIYGAAWQMAGWQDDEHRCWFIDGECVCGNESWLSVSWCKHIDHWRYANHADSNGWARKFRTRPTQLPGEWADAVLFTYDGQPVRHSDIAESTPASGGQLSVTLTSEAALRIGVAAFQIGLGSA